MGCSKHVTPCTFFPPSFVGQLQRAYSMHAALHIFSLLFSPIAVIVSINGSFFEHKACRCLKCEHICVLQLVVCAVH
jgi:hypothetical protein